MIETILRHVLPAAYSLLPAKMNTLEGTAQVLAIGLQETRFLERRQKGGGPARGFWQFEGGAMSGLAEVLTNKQTKAYAQQLLEALRYPTPALTANGLLELRDILAHNDILAGGMARLLVWSCPEKLPARGEASVAWRQYINTWHPGTPHPETWDALYAEAWDRLDSLKPKELHGLPAYGRSTTSDVGPSRPGDSRGRAPHRPPPATAQARRYRTH